ncbi:MAG: SDR family NAD(P)-dependent oxidoreductase [Bacteroidota bacterium]|nr:SDR family NAD(P)-dependent oxidoreductase [Bacteroidota bacterium]
MESFYKNKVTIITGSSMGIGKEIAYQILMLGGKVVLTGRNEERLIATKNEFSKYSESILIHVGDITNYENNALMIKNTVTHFGKIDVLINNAGLSCFGEIGVMNHDVAKQIIDANIYGSLFPVMAALPELKKTKGSVLFVSSLAGIHGLPGYSAYSLSKMSLKALAQSLNAELKLEKVFVGISYVGFTENDKNKKTLSPNGSWINVPSRPKIITNSKKQTALKLLMQIKNKKHSEVQTIVGTIINKFNQFFPSIFNSILKLNYQK